MTLTVLTQALRLARRAEPLREDRRREACLEDRICLRVEINQLIRLFERAAN